MITVILTTSGTYNVFGTNAEGFCLQGNLTIAELKALKVQVDRAVAKAAKKKVKKT
jgi:hypothetical protein